MHLFDINRQKLYSKPIEDTELIDIFEYPHSNNYLVRKERWLDFFNEYSSSNICFYEHTIEALEIIFETNDIIKLQTEIELNLSFEFYKKLFLTKKQIYFNSIESAKKYLVLSLIFSKYPGVFYRSIDSFLSNLEIEIDEDKLDEFFKYLLVKYETPAYIIKHFHHLNSNEIDIIIASLNGLNLRMHILFQIAPTSDEFSKLMTLDVQCFTFKDNILIRGLTIVKLLKLGLNSDFVFTFIRISKVFQANPRKYLSDIDFWSKALQLSAAGREHEYFNLTDIMDYLEYKKYDSDEIFTLKGRTTNSLLRAVDIWHGKIFSENHKDFRKIKWNGIQSEFDLSFEFEENIYKCIQLKSGKELYIEGNELEHCVVTYAKSCFNSLCTIWSMQIQKKNSFKRMMTIEVIEKTIVQARKEKNSLPNPEELKLLKDWSERMGYTVELYKNY